MLITKQCPIGIHSKNKFNFTDNSLLRIMICFCLARDMKSDFAPQNWTGATKKLYKVSRGIFLQFFLKVEIAIFIY